MSNDWFFDNPGLGLGAVGEDGLFLLSARGSVFRVLVDATGLEPMQAYDCMSRYLACPNEFMEMARRKVLE